MRHSDPLTPLLEVAQRITRAEPFESDLAAQVSQLFRTDAGTALCRYRTLPSQPSTVTVAEAQPPTTAHIELCRRLAPAHPGWSPSMRGGGGPVLRLSDLVALPRFWGTEPYVVFHGPEEGRYPANAVLHRSRSELVFLSLQRRARDFSDEEMATLSLVQQVLSAAFQLREALDRLATGMTGETRPATEPPRQAGRGPVHQSDGVLTRREGEVLGLAAAGWTNQRIANRLGVSERTVRKHLGNAYEKTGSSGRVEAAVWWQRHRPEQQ